MNLVIINARPEQTARARCLTQADPAVIEESADGATPRAAGDTSVGRAFVRDCGQRTRCAQVAKWHHVYPLVLAQSLGQQHSRQQGHHRCRREGYPVPHGRLSLVSPSLGNIDPASVARKEKAIAEPRARLLEEHDFPTRQVPPDF
jgi:hypothetical protein